MTIKIRCDKCGASYLCCTQTTRIYGPLIETECPKCNNLVVRNMSKFLKKQTDEDCIGKLEQAREMITLAQQMGREVNEDVPYTKKRKKK